jgi:hypothetical protein
MDYFYIRGPVIDLLLNMLNPISYFIIPCLLKPMAVQFMA